MPKRLAMLVAMLVVQGLNVGAQQAQAPPPAAAAPQTPASATNLGSDPNGNPLRRALKTGHVSNYDESKVARYTLPDPLVSADGKPVRDARSWRGRRAEIVRLYETEIYGRIPPQAPRVAWEVTATDPAARGGTALG